MEHTDWFEGNAHAVRFWLPHLWSLSHRHYGELDDLCSACQRALPSNSGFKRQLLIDSEERLGEFCWRWVSSQSETVAQALRGRLENFARNRSVSPTESDLDELQALAIHHFWQVVSTAHALPEQYAGDLYPEIALNKSAKTAFELKYPLTRGAGAEANTR